MIRGIYTSLSGMQSNQIQQETLSNNISNMNTPGFKSDRAVIKSFDKVLITNKDKLLNGNSKSQQVGNLELKAGIDTIKTNYDQGIIDTTGRNLDFALDGSGFFTIQNNDASELYTRNGQFKINNDGYIVNSQGLKVLGIDKYGNKTPLKVDNPDFKLNDDGTFNVSNNSVKFCISSFNNNDLVKDSSNNYKSNSKPVVSDNTIIKQNCIEKSNVDSVEAITDMISISRSYESNQKVLQQIDETLSKSVNEVGALK